MDNRSSVGTLADRLWRTIKESRLEYCVTAMSLQVVVGKNSVTEGEGNRIPVLEQGKRFRAYPESLLVIEGSSQFVSRSYCRPQCNSRHVVLANSKFCNSSRLQSPSCLRVFRDSHERERAARKPTSYIDATLLRQTIYQCINVSIKQSTYLLCISIIYVSPYVIALLEALQCRTRFKKTVIVAALT